MRNYLNYLTKYKMYYSIYCCVQVNICAVCNTHKE